MTNSNRTLELGAGRVTIINIGNANAALQDWITLPEAERPADYAEVFTRPAQVPHQCVHIALNGRSILVDAGRMVPPGAPPFDPEATWLMAGLAAAGAPPENITDLVITHAHWDHFNATTRLGDGGFVPRFPNARVFLGRPDWEVALRGDAWQNPESLERTTFGVLYDAGLLTPVDGDLDLDHGVKIVAAPGESPGHQMLRIRTGGYTLVCVGDLYHHTIEVAHPAWAVTWAEPNRIQASRAAFVREALAANALLTAAHIPSLGRLHETSAGVAWVSI
jgi:glyoxylase-like metal-dependent hydrolase (beta-lactamase superfamily II)